MPPHQITPGKPGVQTHGNKPVGESDMATVVSALAHLIDLVEGWAYGPLFEKAGVQWPDGKCQAPALVKAKEIIALITPPSGGGR